MAEAGITSYRVPSSGEFELELPLYYEILGLERHTGMLLRPGGDGEQAIVSDHLNELRVHVQINPKEKCVSVILRIVMDGEVFDDAEWMWVASNFKESAHLIKRVP